MLPTSEAAGANEAVEPLYVTVPKTVVAPCLTVNVVALIVNGSIDMLKVAVTILLSATPVALFTGSVEITTGETAAPVVNVHT